MFYSQGKICPPLLNAAYNGYQQIVEMLITHGASVQVKDDRGETPLHKACINGHQDIVELLIASGSEVEARSTDGSTPLHMAAYGQHLEVVRFLQKNGANLDLDSAAMLGDVDLVNRYLQQGVSVNSQISKTIAKGLSLLSISCRYGHQNLVRFLLDKKALINEKTGNYLFVPLHHSVVQGSEEICRVLIYNDANLNIEDVHGNTPLHWAAKLGDRSMTDTLVSFDADIHHLNFNQQTPLFYATEHHNVEIVRMLLERGAEVNLKDTEGYTPLLRSLKRKGGSEVVKVLVSYNADASIRELSRNITPLHLAVGQNDVELVKFLLKKMKININDL